MSTFIMTANHLIDGDAVYLTNQNEWSDKITDAAIANGDAELEALNAQGLAALKGNIVVDPHAVPVRVEDEIPVPTHVKERIRAKGPTTHLHLGKQSELIDVKNAFPTI